MTVATVPLTYTRLSSENVSETLSILIAAMLDSPQLIAVFGADRAVRKQKLQQLFGQMSENPALMKHSIVALQEGHVVAVCGLLAPGECQPTTSQRLKMIPGVVKLGFGPARKAMTWLGAWAKQDLPEAHWHIGPVAVDPALQGQGIGSAIMTEALRTVDAGQAVAFLETDKAINVSFYEKLGFETTAEQLVLDTPNWFMRRPAQTAA